MKLIKHPPCEEWAQIIRRPVMDTRELGGTVANILDDVRRNGDLALREYSGRFDGVELDDFEVRENEYLDAEIAVSQELKDALAVAKANIERFHAVAEEHPEIIETSPGVECWKRSLPIEKVGLYVPAGSAPLFSTVLMLGIPAKPAGFRED